MPISSQLDEPNGPAMSLNANVDEFENSESAFATGLVTVPLTPFWPVSVAELLVVDDGQ